jgi:hypothetical protein
LVLSIARFRDWQCVARDVSDIKTDDIAAIIRKTLDIASKAIRFKDQRCAGRHYQPLQRPLP